MNRPLLPIEERSRFVRDYVRSHPGCLCTEISEALGFPASLVIARLVYRRQIIKTRSVYRDGSTPWCRYYPRSGVAVAPYRYDAGSPRDPLSDEQLYAYEHSERRFSLQLQIIDLRKTLRDARQRLAKL